MFSLRNKKNFLNENISLNHPQYPLLPGALQVQSLAVPTNNAGKVTYVPFSLLPVAGEKNEIAAAESPLKMLCTVFILFQDADLISHPGQPPNPDTSGFSGLFFEGKPHFIVQLNKTDF